MRYATLLLTVMLIVGCRQGRSSGDAPPDIARASSTVPAVTPRPPMVGGSGRAEANSSEMTPTPTVEPTVEGAELPPRQVPTPQPSATVQQAQTQAGVARSDEQPTFNRPGAGSNPAASTTLEEQVRAAVEAIFPPSEWAEAMKVAYCESRYQPTAVEPSGDHVGIFQVAPALHGTVPSDIYGQTVQAYGVYLVQGWGAWSCR